MTIDYSKKTAPSTSVFCGRVIYITFMPVHASLYIHIPFCRSKCSYCDFASFAGMEGLMEPYTAALLKEIAAAPPLKVPTVFIGGGTPSHLPARLMERIIEAIKGRFTLEQGGEFTIEVNPRSAALELFKAYQRAGVNRLSIGVQSFHDATLRLIGRPHSAEDARATVSAARKAGFGNISIDLMYGLPGERLSEVEADLKEALALSPDHISAYQLILEEGTPLEALVRSGKAAMPDDEALCDMGEAVTATLEGKGYRRYEISNYAKEGFQCRHNLAYWLGKPFLGLGSGAHSFLDGKRQANPDDVQEYISKIEINASARQDIHTDEKSRITDFMLMRMRLINNAITYEELSSALSIDAKEYFKKPISRLAMEGYLEANDTGFMLSHKGIQFLNTILLEFVDL